MIFGITLLVLFLLISGLQRGPIPDGFSQLLAKVLKINLLLCFMMVMILELNMKAQMQDP